MAAKPKPVEGSMPKTHLTPMSQSAPKPQPQPQGPPSVPTRPMRSILPKTNKRKLIHTTFSIPNSSYFKIRALTQQLRPHFIEGKEASSLASSKDLEITCDQSQPESGVQPDHLFEENFKQLKKWVDLKSPKHGILLALRERRSGRLGTALKALNDIIRDDGEPPKKKLYELKLSLLDEIGWSHLATYERQWMHVRFPASLPLF
ncbi:tripeptidyl-peptidase 2-like [Quercus lobata]|uniref:tripeptidyl-peptidase 2-like n=1 Tax=Quercus lobata TaxID=97700 RepID=UPI00124404C0|nr:tripeptidyl-peptidase 2-like [Quercus lobata]